MQQKVWVIGDEDWNSPSANPRQRASKEPDQTLEATVVLGPALKNPALAFSLSLVVWGGGQFYLKESRRGILFLSGMLVYWGLIAGLLAFAAPLGQRIANSGHQSLLVSFAVMALLLGLLAWMINAADAYLRARPADAEAFAGVEQAVWPFLGSLFFPGWGQFLNGQPRKGWFFLGAGVTGIFSVMMLWSALRIIPLLSSENARIILEWYLIAALALAPLALLGWVMSVFDAVRACRQRYRKKFTLDNVGFWVWSKEVLRELCPRATTVLSLALAVSVAMQLTPRQYYLDLLEQIRQVTLHQHLVILPELARTLMALLTS